MLSEAELKVLDQIKGNIILQNHFFGRVSKLKWFLPLKQEGYFSPVRAPSPRKVDEDDSIEIPRWNVLPYLERVAKQVGPSPDDIYARNLLEIIKEVTNYHVQHGKKLENYQTWWYFVRIIFNLPNQTVTADVIELIPVWLDSQFSFSLPGSDVATKLVPKFLEGSEEDDVRKAERIVEIITDVRWESVSEARKKLFGIEEESKTVVRPSSLMKLFRDNDTAIAQKCGEELILVFANNLRQIFERDVGERGDEEDYSHIWLRSLFVDSRYPPHNAKETLARLLKRLLVLRAQVDIQGTANILVKFLSDDYPHRFFKRIVLYLAGMQWSHYRDFVWRMIESPYGRKYLTDSRYRPEMYEILRRNARELTRKEKGAIRRMIEGGSGSRLSRGNEQTRLAHWKQTWYSALRSDPDFEALYQIQKKVTGRDIKVDFTKDIEIEWVHEQASLTNEEMLRMSNQELVVYLNSYRVKPGSERTVDALAGMLENAVRNTPAKFTQDMTPFLELGYLYVYHFLNGLKECWTAKRSINWTKTCRFIGRYVEQEGFWEDQLKVTGDDWPATHVWVTGVIGELIQAGSNDDSWALPKGCLESTRKTLLGILGQQREAEQQDSGMDYLTEALNSSLGKVLVAVIYLALYGARVQKGSIKKRRKWSSDTRAAYQALLRGSVGVAYTYLGHYLSNLFYLDSEWIREEVGSLSASGNGEMWEAFMEGYLHGNPTRGTLYDLMRNHYEDAIERPFKHESARKRLVQHICLYYLWDKHLVTNPGSLLRKLLDSWYLPYISEVIEFFWTQREYLTAPSATARSMTDRVLSFWKVVYDRYKAKPEAELTGEDRQILSDLLRLTCLLKRIDDETFDWLRLSAPHATIHFNSYLFLEYLDGIRDDKSITYIAQAFLSVLSTSTPDYDRKHICSIVERVYRHGKVEDGDEICKVYIARGYEFLRDIYEKQHPTEHSETE